MRLPSKTTEYGKSVVAYFAPILSLLADMPLPPMKIYTKLNQEKNIGDYLDALDCLYALGQINLNGKGELCYVDRNTL